MLRDADQEAVQVLSSWRREQWSASKAHHLQSWDASTLQAFLKSLELPVKLPSTMTGAQLQRLGPRKLEALCGPAAPQLLAALRDLGKADEEAKRGHRETNARLTALGKHKAWPKGRSMDLP